MPVSSHAPKPEEAPALEAPPSPAPAPASDAALVARVDDMVAAAKAGAAAAAPLASLDAELAALADDLMAGSIQNAEEVLAGAAAPPPPVERETVQPAPALDRELSAAPAARNEAAPPAPAPAITAPAAAAPVPAPTPDPRPAAGPRRGLLDLVNGALRRLAAAISSPLAARGPLTRQLVGYVALTQLFFAACLWAYVLLVRDTTPSTEAPALALVSHDDGHTRGDAHSAPSGDDHAPPAHDAAPASQAHGAPAPAAGGSHAPKPDAHAPKPDAHGAPASGSHGGAKPPAKGGKEGARPGVRTTETLGEKRPGARSSVVLPPKPGAKPAAKAEAKPSGGH